MKRIIILTVAIFSLAGVCYELIQWYLSYIMLLEARKSTVIPMEKVISNNKLITFIAKVNMTTAKWKYHQGLPLIILENKQNSFNSLFLNRNIKFELIDTNQKHFEIIILNKDIKKCFKWMQKRLNISTNNYCFSPIKRLKDGRYKYINYIKGTNIIKFTFFPPLINNFNNLNAFIYFRESTETAEPIGYFLKALLIGIIGIAVVTIGFSRGAGGGDGGGATGCDGAIH